MKKKFFLAGLMIFILSAAACAEVGDYILKDGKIYRVDGKKETLLEDDEPGRARTDAGLYSWILVDPELSEGMKNSKPGIYFFIGEDEKPLAFLPIEQAGACMIEFSPSGEKLLISRGVEFWQDLILYFVENGKFVKKKSFISAAHSFWIDPHRFIFTSIDKDKGPRTKEEDDWWNSPALYDTVENDLVILKNATETKNYFITGYDYETGVIDITESSVKNKNDWSDPDKIEYKEITVETPAAG